MPHKTPNATCGCCAPCTPPEVTCDLDGGNFVYTVEHAVMAWVEVYYPGNIQGVDPPDESTPVVLTDGAASGSVVSAGVGYNYCIRAISDCGEALCCTPCSEVVCRIGYRFVGLDYETVYIGWEVQSDNPITYAAIDGNIYISDPSSGGNPYFWSGTLTYSVGSMPDQICIQGRNDCNAECNTCFNVPCCWTVDDLVIEFSDIAGTYVQTCNITPKLVAFDFDSYYFNSLISDSVVTLSGLSGLNGTNLFSLAGNRRIFGTPSIYHGICWGGGELATGVMGSVTIDWKGRYVPCCLYTPPEDPCGNSLYGVLVTDQLTTYEGEFYIIPGYFGTEIILKVTTVTIRKLRERQRFPPDFFWCISNPYLNCQPGYTIDPDDSGYCIGSGTPAEMGTPASIGIAIHQSSYSCVTGSPCDTPGGFCQMGVVLGFEGGGYPGLCASTINENTTDKVCIPDLDPGAFNWACNIGTLNYRSYYA